MDMEQSGVVKKLSLKDFESYNTNPSFYKKLGSIGIGEVEVDDTGVMLVDQTTGGEVTMFKVVGGSKRRVIDRKQFVKVYGDSFDKLDLLSNSGIRVLTYIWRILNINAHEFYLDVEDAVVKCGYKKSTSIYGGIIDLLNHKFIFRATGTHRYFVNVEMFFNGSRTTLPPLVKLQEKIDSKQ